MDGHLKVLSSSQTRLLFTTNNNLQNLTLSVRNGFQTQPTETALAILLPDIANK